MLVKKSLLSRNNSVQLIVPRENQTYLCDGLKLSFKDSLVFDSFLMAEVSSFTAKGSVVCINNPLINSTKDRQFLRISIDGSSGMCQLLSVRGKQ